ncbi:sulfotransferase family 2 domain-containing protein [Amphritea sp. HPY]|uniref:sulfotransferase family 2 domain-containing protein n=1 Tax=Amphritea sp. HPY TaxID=3421652 RepID=UPI003D7D81C3
MPIFSKGNKRLFLIHIPKSAGSSVEKVAKRYGWQESFSERGKSLGDLQYYRSTPQHLHASVLEKIFDFEKFNAVIMVVRNPYVRFKSEYYWQVRQGITRLMPSVWIEDTLCKYSDNKYIYDNHIRPQSEFLLSFEDLQVFKLEDDGVRKAEEVFLNLSPAGLSVEGIVQNFKRNFLGETREKVSIKDEGVEAEFYSCRSVIYDFYKKDYELFSYDKL